MMGTYRFMRAVTVNVGAGVGLGAQKKNTTGREGIRSFSTGLSPERCPTSAEARIEVLTKQMEARLQDTKREVAKESYESAKVIRGCL